MVLHVSDLTFSELDEVLESGYLRQEAIRERRIREVEPRLDEYEYWEYRVDHAHRHDRDVMAWDEDEDE